MATYHNVYLGYAIKLTDSDFEKIEEWYFEQNELSLNISNDDLGGVYLMPNKEFETDFNPIHWTGGQDEDLAIPILEIGFAKNKIMFEWAFAVEIEKIKALGAQPKISFYFLTGIS